MAGISICRNQNLANLFYRLHLIEAYGTGLTKIMEAYDSSLKKPILSTTKNSFKITLPNINAKDETNFASKISDNITVSFISELGRDEEQVLDYIKKHGSITRPKAEQLLGTSPSTASRLIRKMVQSGLLLQHGKARNVYYTLVK